MRESSNRNVFSDFPEPLAGNDELICRINKTKFQFKLINPGIHPNTVFSDCRHYFRNKYADQHFHKLK